MTRKKKTLIKQNQTNTHKVGVLCMTFCCSGYGVHVSAAPCMMKSDEDSGLDVNKRRIGSRREESRESRYLVLQLDWLIYG